MRNQGNHIMKQKLVIAPWSLLAAVLVFSCGLAAAYAQTPATQTQTAPQTQAPNNPQGQAPEVQNLPTALNFTPEQQQQWRQINREFTPQQLAAKAKVRDARLALDQAMESPNPNEETIKLRAKELADAQSAMTQLVALRQARVLQMLTPEQRVKLKEIKERAQALRNEQAGNGVNRQPLRRNTNAPTLTPAQRKALRQQQKQLKPKS
jgi:Spy/CpxP family protein refolding chaperone